MRVISGSFKGKKIFEPKDNKTRPLKDLAKESIFNIIEHSNKFNTQLIDSNILDLFSGVTENENGEEVNEFEYFKNFFVDE